MDNNNYLISKGLTFGRVSNTFVIISCRQGMRGSSNWRAISTSVRRYNLLALDFTLPQSCDYFFSCRKLINFVNYMSLSKNRNQKQKVSSRIARYKTERFCLLLSQGKLSGSNQQLFLQVNLENSNQALLELQENHKAAISALKEKEFIISKLLLSGKQELIIIY